MIRKIYYWKLRTTELQLGERTLIMGILNVTPDSFSDGGKFSDPDRAYARALEMEEQGADIIDVGAESTRPGSKRISADEEWQRLLPILKRLRGKLRAPLSLDTYKHETAERAMEYGVEILNDPSGLTFDAELAKTAANANAGLILNHMRGTPETWAKLPPIPDVISTVGKEMDATASRARRGLVEKSRIVLDPGLGFGKRKEQNAEILAHLDRLAGLDYPILVGASRKSFLAQSTEGQTLQATSAAVTAAILRGAHIVRVHDVAEMRAVASVADEIARYGLGVDVDEKKEARPAVRPKEGPARYGDGEKAKPTRPPLAIRKLPPVEERPAARPPVREEFPRREESPGREAREFPKKEWKPRPAAGDREQRPPRSFERDKERGGPPSRSFRPGADRPPRSNDRPGDRGPRDRGPGSFRPGVDRPQKSGDRRDDRGGPPSRPFRPGGDRPGGPGKYSRNDGPPRPAGPGGRPSGGRPQSGRPSGPRPSGGRPAGGPPKRPFRKRP